MTENETPEPSMTIAIPNGLRRLCRPVAFRGVALRLALLSLALLPSACQMDDPNAFAPACPVVEVPGEAADLVAYAGDAHDIAHMTTRVGLTRVTGNCQQGSRGGKGRARSITTNISVGMDVTRGPATKGRSVEIPYFIAVVYDGEIKSKKQFVETVTFPPNVTHMLTHTRIVPIDLPVSHRVTIDGYHIEVGFQLTPDQLAYNRSHLITPSFHPL
ncbi:hypothetical protein [Gluconacetobacter azotocaptans]|uniref:hypothetical protein n=1 Tax=Gluconacetobacter azotocaptans TaxID=142834 RepID=UPI001F0365BD|nr:hypothetical protein [Gluconacetobacter azotocaptans]